MSFCLVSICLRTTWESWPRKSHKDPLAALGIKGLLCLASKSLRRVGCRARANGLRGEREACYCCGYAVQSKQLVPRSVDHRHTREGWSPCEPCGPGNSFPSAIPAEVLPGNYEVQPVQPQRQDNYRDCPAGTVQTSFQAPDWQEELEQLGTAQASQSILKFSPSTAADLCPADSTRDKQLLRGSSNNPSRQGYDQRCSLYSASPTTGTDFRLLLCPVRRTRRETAESVLLDVTLKELSLRKVDAEYGCILDW